MMKLDMRCNTHLKTFQAMTSATHRCTAARRTLWIAGTGQTGLGGGCAQFSIEATRTEFALVASRIVAALLANATLEERIIAAALRVAIALTYFALASRRPGTILEHGATLAALQAACIVLAGALQQAVGVACIHVLRAIRMAMAIEASADTQLLETVEAALLQRLRVEQPVDAIIQIRRRVHTL